MSEIIAHCIHDREIVILPKGRWYAINIAFFKTTGTSNVKFAKYENTWFPMLGCFLSPTQTPIDNIGDSVKLSTNYLVKLGGTFPKLFKGNPKLMPEWIFAILYDYVSEFDLDIQIAEINDIQLLEHLKDKYAELFLIYECLSFYFTDIWQLHLSIALSQLFETGIWIKPELSNFVKYIKTPFVIHTVPSQIIELDRTDNLSLFNFLRKFKAQCKFDKLSPLPFISYSDKMLHKQYEKLHNAIFLNEQRVDQKLFSLKKSAQYQTDKPEIKLDPLRRHTIETPFQFTEYQTKPRKTTYSKRRKKGKSQRKRKPQFSPIKTHKN